MSTEIALRATMGEIEGHRTRALDLLGRAFDCLEDAYRAAKQAAPHETLYLFDEDVKRDMIGSDRAGFLEKCRRRIDSSVWSHLLKHMELEKLMDKTAREDFAKQLRENPPEATADNCFATMKTLVEDSGTIWRRGIAVAFSGLDRRFRSHDGFKVGARIVLSYAFRDFGGWARETDVTIRDVERVFLLLDGKPHPEWSASFAAKINAHRARPFELEDDYFRIRCFKNGNAHLWFKRPDLVRQVNLLLAEWYGETIGEGADVAKSNAPPEQTRAVARTLSFFETPEALATELVELAQVKPGELVLEPSAGKGAIALALKRAGARVDVCEVEPSRFDYLRGLGFVGTNADFLELKPAPLYDRIVMNPPFDAGRDIDHVTHALGWLKPGGVLVAVMSAGVEYREDARTEAFRKLVASRVGTIRPLPPLSFASSGTNVNTVRVVFGLGR